MAALNHDQLEANTNYRTLQAGHQLVPQISLDWLKVASWYVP